MFGKRKNADTSPEKVVVTLVGTVDKVIPRSSSAESDKVQISVKSAEALYREIRIENTLYDRAGIPVSLKEGAEVEVTIEADPKATSKKLNSTRPPKSLPTARSRTERE